jgi:hypothetical protein
MTIAVEYKNPSDPAAKPPPLTAAQFVLPPGTELHNAAVPRCRATDEEIRARGRNACPQETLVATGRLIAITGAGAPADPFDGEALFFNGEGEIVEIVLVRGSDQAAGFDRIKIDGSKLTAHPPALPGGPPDGRTSVKRVEMSVPAPVGGAPAYVTTPPACPPDGLWRSSGSFGFGDGGSTTVPDTAACDPPRAPTLTVRLSPSSVRAGRAEVRVQVSSSVPGCASGATVRLGRVLTRTDAGGRAVLRKHLSQPRTVTVRAAKRGCGRGVASLVVRRRP